jgi:hypothetical protein
MVSNDVGEEGNFMDTNNITIYIALYGAILSTLVFIWNIYIFSKDKGELKFDVELDHILDTKTHEISDYPYVIFRIVNTGKRPTTLISIGGTKFGIDKRKKYDSHFSYFISDLPLKMNPGDYYKYMRPVVEYKNLKSLYVEDSNGKRYKLRKKYIKMIQRYFQS